MMIRQQFQFFDTNTIYWMTVKIAKSIITKSSVSGLVVFHENTGNVDCTEYPQFCLHYFSVESDIRFTHSVFIDQKNSVNVYQKIIRRIVLFKINFYVSTIINSFCFRHKRITSIPRFMTI